MSTSDYSENFEKALDTGRPPNIKKLFPNSKALIVSGKYIDQGLLSKGNCMTIAANGRSSFVIKGSLLAAQRANAAVIIEIARSEGGCNAYCPTSLWNIARQTDAYMNLGLLSLLQSMLITLVLRRKQILNLPKSKSRLSLMQASHLLLLTHPICRMTKIF